MGMSISEKLVAARHSKGLSPDELANIISIEAGEIRQYESGEKLPDSGILIKLAHALGVKTDEFFLPSNEKMEGICFREEEKHDVQEIAQIKTTTLGYLERYKTLEASFQAQRGFTNPIKNLLVEDEGDAERAAFALRKAWKLGESPIINVVGLLERKGVKVMEISRSLKFEGLSALVGGTPVVVINLTVKEVTRRRFTVLHELAHLILNFRQGLPHSKIESLCDYFAGAFLLPEGIMHEEFAARTKISVNELVSLKEYYGASIRCILVRAAHLELKDWGAYEKWKNIDQKVSNSGKFNGDEKPKRFEYLLWRSLAEGKITMGKAAVLANVPEGQMLNQAAEMLEFV